MRLRMARSVPKKPWEETRAAYASRLKAACQEINDDLDVDGLCRRLPDRIQELINRKGDRLTH